MPKIVDEQMREATRHHIMREAAREFARLGFDQANINIIAEQAGIGKGTIYLYFENKRELFLSMLRAIAQSHLSAIQEVLARQGSLQSKLEQLFCAFAHLAEEESDSFSVYMSALYGVNRAFQAEATKLLCDYIAAITQLLEDASAQDEVLIDDVEAVALMILSLTESFILSARVLKQSEQSLLQQSKKTAQFIMYGLSSTALEASSSSHIA